MLLIGFFVVMGVMLLLGELLIFTGAGLAGVLSVASYVAASYLAWDSYGWTGVIITLGIIIAVSAISAVLCMRSGTWRKLTLNNSIDSVSQKSPAERITVGTRCRTITRLAPSGKIEIDGVQYEARSTELVAPQTEVEVVGFDNFTVLVKVVA